MGTGGPAASPSGGVQHVATHYYISPPHELQPGLKDEDVQQIDEVAEVVHEQPAVDVCRRLVGESPADGDQPAVPVPGDDNEEQPQHVHKICARGTTPPLAGHTSLVCANWLRGGVFAPCPAPGARRNPAAGLLSVASNCK